eukprot:TRINITY_DN137_c0_g1_i3.p1 TRINITY_DN137_c0_g1~~TRINITY_DN137_c0_g1_i3.p1  ORF type:complete len:233 (+),score=43.12 TRINITY_DN137_c0_g1_i3:478-1176(+)
MATDFTTTVYVVDRSTNMTQTGAMYSDVTGDRIMATSNQTGGSSGSQLLLNMTSLNFTQLQYDSNNCSVSCDAGQPCASGGGGYGGGCGSPGVQNIFAPLQWTQPGGKCSGNGNTGMIWENVTVSSGFNATTAYCIATDSTNTPIFIEVSIVMANFNSTTMINFLTFETGRPDAMYFDIPSDCSCVAPSYGSPSYGSSYGSTSYKASSYGASSYAAPPAMTEYDLSKSWFSR